MLLSKVLITIFFLSMLTVADAQVNRYLVFFKDKAGTVYTTTNPSPYLSQKAIARRTKHSIEITSLDLPVNQSYIQALRDIGIKVFFKTRWMNGVLVQCDASSLADIEALNFVQSVEFIAPGERLSNGGRKKMIEQTTEDAVTTAQQLNMIGVDSMHQQGYYGEGITIAVLDSGFPGVKTSSFFNEAITDGRIDLSVSYDFVFNTTDVFRYDQHGAKVFSVIAAHKQDVFNGTGYEANYQLYVTEDVATEYRIEEYNWLFAAERADSAGADIISTSLGYNLFDDPSMDYKKSDIDGKTAVISRAAQFAAERGMLVVCAAGNEGSNSWGIITPPSDAKDVLAIANVNIFGSRNATSSIGPTAEGRVKPDLAALGTNVSVVTPGESLATATGTSFAAPLIAGLAAGLWQAYPDLSNRDIIDVLKRTASQANKPDNYLGWGIPNFIAAKNFLDFSEQKAPFEIYPNPFSESVSIRPQNPDEISVCKLEVLNVQGQLVENSDVSFNWLRPSYLANFSHLPPGLYIFRISFLKKVNTFKVVKY